MANPLWSACARFYLNRSEITPAAPVDWAQQANFGNQSLMELQELERFARDPVRREFCVRAKKETRQVIHRMIDQLGLDMTHVTERKGSSYTMVCTKTRATCERTCKQHRSDIGDMRRLFALPPADHPDLAEIAQRLHAACDLA